VSFHLVVVAVYSFAIVGMGVWTSRLVRTSSEFFVAGRSLSAGLVFSSMLAANIGAGSLFGASGLAYRDGVSAWWWVGSAGLGSLVFAFAVAPRLWALAKEHDFYTTGDYLEFRYGATVRGVATALVGIGSLALLAGQLIAGATILNLLTGMPRWVGALTGGAIMTIYFTSGGLLGSAWINTAQLVVMVVGLGLAVPAALLSVGGLGNLMVDAPAFLVDPMYSAGPGSGWTLLALTGPAFIVSPGLIQKAYGARSADAVRVGVAANALALLAFAFVPVLLGLVARVAAPGIENPNEVLPRVLTQLLPPWLGAIALAAVFSTAVDTCDAVLFMISSSATKDVYKRFINPAATDAALLRVGRRITVVAGLVGVALAIMLETVIGAVTVFYSLLVVSLLVPVVGGLYLKRAGSREALAAIAGGVLTLFAVRAAGPAYLPAIDPTLAGICVAATLFLGFMLARIAAGTALSTETTTAR
jgi:SSS family solute:Na+ symporter